LTVPRHAWFIASAGVAIALVVASCGTFDTTTQSSPSGREVAAPSAARSTSTPAATSTATPAPAPTAVPSHATLQFLSEGGTQVFPGRYVTHLRPGLILTVDQEVKIDCAPGYRCRGDVDVNLPDWLDIEFGHDHPIEVHIMVFDQVFAPSAARPLINPPDDLEAWVAAMPGVKVVTSKPITVGGIPASQLDLETGEQDVIFGPLSGVPEMPTLGFGAHQAHRVDVLRASGRVVVIGLGPVRPEDSTIARLPEAAAQLQPLVDSITWQ
jgi:hypothetical protein